MATFGILIVLFSDLISAVEFLITLIFLDNNKDTDLFAEAIDKGWKVEFNIKVL